MCRESDPSHEDFQERAESPKLKPDAVAHDGVLTLLTEGFLEPNAPDATEQEWAHGQRHQRALSVNTREQLDAQNQQLQFAHNRFLLTQWLSDIVEILHDLLIFHQSGEEVQLPKTLSLTILQVDPRANGSGSSTMSDAAYSRSVAGLLEGRLTSVIHHVEKLRERLESTISRVLVTGDLNAGKSSFCNALLRRQVLPVDQQPCTEVFTEVVDASRNNDVEEVHAIGHGVQYDISRKETYSRFALERLIDLVHEPLSYALLKVYLKDLRSPERSLLANGVVDICLIDAPGLNVDNLQTEEVFGRQEEIDLVIFVVSAENHFTQSSKEFVSDTAREKSLVFIVVNNFDRIHNQAACRNRILSQVAHLAPETHKGAGDFVHFVTVPPELPPDDDNDESPAHGPGRPDFDRLEASLRQFVLQKRSASKLAPAQTYLRNVLSDLVLLSNFNADVAKAQREQYTEKLSAIGPSLDASTREYISLSDRIDKDVEQLVRTLYSDSYEFLSRVLTDIGDEPIVEWYGYMDIWGYVARTRNDLVAKVQTVVAECEGRARDITASAVDAIKQLGVLHVGDRPAFSKVFQRSMMFSRRKDTLGRDIKASFTIGDLFNLSGILQRPPPVLLASKYALAATSSSVLNGTLTAFSLVGGAQFLLSHSVRIAAASGVAPKLLRKLAIPGISLAVVGLGMWIMYELPRTIPRRLARKLTFELDELGYIRANADRIASEARKVLRYPTEDVRTAFQSKIELQTRQRDEWMAFSKQAVAAEKLFGHIGSRAGKLLNEVTQMNLDVD